MTDPIEIPAKKKLSAVRRRLRVAAYCRVSTPSEEQASSLELQQSSYIRIIEGNSLWSSAGVYAEVATGLKEKARPEFCKLLRKCRKGKVDLILTKSVSRMGRNALDMLRTLRELRLLGVDVYFESENLWLQEQHMEFFLTTYAAFAQAESENKSAILNGASGRDSATAPPVMPTSSATVISGATTADWRSTKRTRKRYDGFFK